MNTVKHRYSAEIQRTRGLLELAAALYDTSLSFQTTRAAEQAIQTESRVGYSLTLALTATLYQVASHAFFKSLLSNLAMVLAKTDLAIASRYAELVPDEIEIDLKVFAAIRHRTCRKAARRGVERYLPAVVEPGHAGEPDLAHDLRPQVQRLVGVLPGCVWQRGPLGMGHSGLIIASPQPRALRS